MIETITVLRYSSSKTKAGVLAEAANPDSRDWGTGTRYNGLCVAIEAGQDFDVAGMVPKYQPWRDYARVELDCIVKAEELIANLSGPKSRTMWRMTVDRKDIIGLASRVCGGLVPCFYADGVLLRPGAEVLSLSKVVR